MTGVLIRRGAWDTGTHRGDATCRHREKVAMNTPMREASEGTYPAVTLISDLYRPEL